MNTRFPEDIFEIKNPQLYNKIKTRGINIAKDKSILFCGIVRNVADVIELNLARIKSTATHFKNSDTFLFENHSTDETVDILKKLHVNYDSQSMRDDYLSEVDALHYNRCRFLAKCRNKYWDYVFNHSTHYDYICVVDLDVQGGWSYDGFYHGVGVLEDRADNACVSAYGILADYSNNKTLEEVSTDEYIMYDSFTFRPLGYECKTMSELSKFNHIRVNPGDRPIMVDSNFNGMAIYKTNYFLQGTYRSEKINPNLATCEHVLFHEDIRKAGGKIVMDPAMLFSYSKHRYCK